MATLTKLDVLKKLVPGSFVHREPNPAIVVRGKVDRTALNSAVCEAVEKHLETGVTSIIAGPAMLGKEAYQCAIDPKNLECFTAASIGEAVCAARPTIQISTAAIRAEVTVSKEEYGELVAESMGNVTRLTDEEAGRMALAGILGLAGKKLTAKLEEIASKENAEIAAAALAQHHGNAREDSTTDEESEVDELVG